MQHSAFIPKALSEEIRLFTIGRTSFYFKDFVTASVLGGVFFLNWFSLVSSWLSIPYLIFAALSSIYMVLPANKTNPGKRNWEAILFLILKSRATVFMLNPRRDSGAEIVKTLFSTEEGNND